VSIASFLRRLRVRPAPSPEAPPDLDATRLSESLRQTFTKPGYSPPVLPAVALELLALFRRPDVSVDDVIAALEKDAILASRVMRVAETPEYATRVPARSLADATRRLGLDTLTSIVWEVALSSRVFRREGYADAMADVQRHSLAVARIGRIVGARVHVEPEHVFLCGLLHDVGMAAALLALGDGRDRAPIEAVWSAIGELHEPASGMVTSMWGLPERIAKTVGTHHARTSSPVVRVLKLAEALADEMDLGIDVDPQPAAIGELAAALRLDEVALDALRGDVTRSLVRDAAA